uniref:Uncharacterized protein n=1 Tax=Onchocerca volvulus TaxID=6282 RepID=A0A8R1XV75_ONCVO
MDIRGRVECNRLIMEEGEDFKAGLNGCKHRNPDVYVYDIENMSTSSIAMKEKGVWKSETYQNEIRDKPSYEAGKAMKSKRQEIYAKMNARASCSDLPVMCVVVVNDDDDSSRPLFLPLPIRSVRLGWVSVIVIRLPGGRPSARPSTSFQTFHFAEGHEPPQNDESHESVETSDVLASILREDCLH